jgi:hypothetical protein
MTNKKTITSLTELVNELRAEQLKKKDFVVPSKLISMQDGKLVVTNSQNNAQLSEILTGTGISTDGLGDQIILQPLDTCHSHLSDKLQIPKKYYDRMKNGALGLLDKNVSHWFETGEGNYFLRTFINQEETSGVARALLSDRYGIIDNYDVLMACLEAMKDSGLPDGFLTIENCEISEKKFYLRVVSPETDIHAPRLLQHYRVPNNPSRDGITGIMSGFVVTNSEVGFGGFSISPRVVIHACSNGMVFKDDAFSRIHLGAKMAEYQQISWSQETKQKNYELVMSQVKDAIKTFVSTEYIGKRIAKFEEVGDWTLQNPVDCIKNVTKALTISAEKENEILKYFTQGGLNNAFGVAQALTFFAHETKSPDEQHDLECASVEVLENIQAYDKPFVKERGVKQNPALN